MIDFNNFNSEELARIGIAFETEEAAELFVEKVMKDLEIRIGQEISRKVSPEKLEFFDRCSNEEEYAAWLNANVPDYKDIVLEKREEIEEELRIFRTQIPGNVMEHEVIYREELKADGQSDGVWLEKIYLANREAPVDELFKIIEHHYNNAGEAFRKGILSEQDFYLSTNPLTIFRDLLKRKGHTEFDAQSLKQGDGFQSAYHDWQETGKIITEPWMERTIFSSMDIKESAEWLFRVIKNLRIPPSYFVKTVDDTGKSSIGIETSDDRSKLLLQGKCRNHNTIGKLMRSTSIVGNKYYLLVDLTQVTFEVTSKKDRLFRGTGFIGDYMRTPGYMEMEIMDDYFVKIRFNDQTITPLQGLWGTYNISNLCEKWADWFSHLASFPGFLLA